MTTKRQPNDNHMSTKLQPNVNIVPTKWRQVDNQITTMCQSHGNHVATMWQPCVCIEEKSLAEFRLLEKRQAKQRGPNYDR